MKTTLLGALLAALLLVGAERAHGEDLTLFSAATAGADAWGWGDAKIKKELGGGFSIRENNLKTTVGDVYVLERFAYLPDGVVELNVDKVLAGNYTVQVLAFKGEANIGSADLVTQAKTGGKLQFVLNTVKLPAETSMIGFKIWVGGAKGAAIVLNDLKYTLSIPTEKIAYDKPITSNSTDMMTDKTSWAPGDNGGKISLKSNDPADLIGSAVLPDVMKNPKDGTLLLHVPAVENGNITIQLVAFDDKAAYLNSVEVINKVGAGWHAVRLNQVQWPEGTDSFKVKIWIGGVAGSIATATVQRVMVVK